jgi:hypothetical protein
VDEVIAIAGKEITKRVTEATKKEGQVGAGEGRLKGMRGENRGILVMFIQALRTQMIRLSEIKLLPLSRVFSGIHFSADIAFDLHKRGCEFVILP